MKDQERHNDLNNGKVTEDQSFTNMENVDIFWLIVEKMKYRDKGVNLCIGEIKTPEHYTVSKLLSEL